MTYLKRQSRRQTPQTAPIPGTSQIRNSAGGFAWAVDEGTRLRRFLILGIVGFDTATPQLIADFARSAL